MLEKIRTILSIGVVICGILASIAGFLGGLFVTPAEAEEIHKVIFERLDAHDARFEVSEQKLLELQLTTLKGNYYILVGKDSLSDSEQLELEIIKSKIIQLEKALAAQ